MKVLIIYAHPYEKSFNHSILKIVENSIKQNDAEFDVINLYADGFNPAYTQQELALFREGKTTDQLIEKYQNQIKEAQKLVFVFPIWWNDMPAIVKGFIDKVMKKNFAYKYQKGRMFGLLTNIKDALILTTSSSPTIYLNVVAGTGINKYFKTTLKQIGIKRQKWINCSFATSNQIALEKHLNKLQKLITKFISK